EAGQSPEEAIRTALGHFAPPAYAPESPSDLPDATTTPPGPDPETPSESIVPGEGRGVPNEVRGSATNEGYSVPSEARGPASDEGCVVPSLARGRNLSIPPDFSRHSRGCVVCSHPDRDAIEADFIRWRSPDLIAKEHKISNRSSICRHAHSTGLFAWRKQELGRTLESILECAEQIPLASADIIIRAARIYSHLDDHGKWSEPARINFILTGPIPANFSSEAFGPRGIERILSESSGRIHEQLEGEENATAAEHSSPMNPASSNSPQLRNSVNSMNPEEKENS
ncbi:MAG: hypothetical protein WB780_01970, partial [Candidatus Acidiferrales bacterium]